MRLVFLDTGPLGVLTNPKGTPEALACQQWVRDPGVRQSLEQKVELSPGDSSFREQTDKDQRSSEPVPS